MNIYCMIMIMIMIASKIILKAHKMLSYLTWCIQWYLSVLCSAGLQCEVNVDDCAPKQGSWEPRCLNGGQCVDGVGRYTCSCPPGFVGEHCEGDLNECLSGPCHYPGSLDCVQLVNDYQCRCRLGYTGTYILAAQWDTAAPCLVILYVTGYVFFFMYNFLFSLNLFLQVVIVSPWWICVCLSHATTVASALWTWAQHMATHAPAHL